ncbi:MAG: glycine zipper 2TM domain-containing protein [Gammaproteobacteria bacterium]|jgi:surface antigen|nr:glycine zipper 2TM domain-containing protein [Gammaproteobacteria bacterium]
MKKIISPFVAILFAIGVTACETSPTQEEVGAITGAIVGGVVGNQIGGGKGRRLATAGGVILGAMVGARIGRHLDREDERRALLALENNRTGQYSRWTNPDSGAVVAVVPTRTYEQSGGQYCREYQTEVTVGGENEKAYGTACRQPDGSWQIVN